MSCPSQEILDKILPSTIADDFFDALYGGAEEGAYDIKLICEGSTQSAINLAFVLERRPGKCLKCSLTYGLPQVFERHPVINLGGICKALAETQGWGGQFRFKLGKTIEINEERHEIPLTIQRT